MRAGILTQPRHAFHFGYGQTFKKFRQFLLHFWGEGYARRVYPVTCERYKYPQDLLCSIGEPPGVEGDPEVRGSLVSRLFLLA